MVNYHYADVFVVGYRKTDFGWLLTFEDGNYAGVMELGVQPFARRHLR
ncbi:hypothetical protein [Neobacillus massiliamazoniensis]|nr:hypothetical protein [Neobacillus massiliamazoniensis]